jgi:hypothetical protein
LQKHFTERCDAIEAECRVQVQKLAQALRILNERSRVDDTTKLKQQLESLSEKVTDISNLQEKEAMTNKRIQQLESLFSSTKSDGLN